MGNTEGPESALSILSIAYHPSKAQSASATIHSFTTVSKRLVFRAFSAVRELYPPLPRNETNTNQKQGKANHWPKHWPDQALQALSSLEL